MLNGHSDADKKVEQLRAELHRRKLGFDFAAPQAAASEVALPPENHSEPNDNARGSSFQPTSEAADLDRVEHLGEALPADREAERGETAARNGPAESKPRLIRAEGALRRAVIKSELGRRWPRLLRSLRRNQAAVNESIIRTARALLDTAEWLCRKCVLLEARLGHQIDRAQEQQTWLASLDQTVHEAVGRAAERESESRRHEEQLAVLTQAIAERLQQATTQDESLKAHQDALAQFDLKIREQRIRSVVQEQEVAAQSARLAGDESSFGVQLSELQATLLANHEATALRLKRIEEATEEYQRHDRERWESAHNELKHTREDQSRIEHKNHVRTEEAFHQIGLLLDWIAEQASQFNELTTTTSAYARQTSQLSLASREQQQAITGLAQEQAQRLADIQVFIAAQQKQNSTEERQLEGQQEQLRDLRSAVDGQVARTAEQQQDVTKEQKRLSELTDRLLQQQAEERTSNQLSAAQLRAAEQRLTEIQASIAAQEAQHAEKFRQFQAQQNQQEQLARELRDAIDDRVRIVANEQEAAAARHKLLSDLTDKFRQEQAEDRARAASLANQVASGERQLGEIGNFIRAQDIQNSEHSRQLQGQQLQISEVRAELATSSGVASDWLLSLTKQKQQLADLQNFIEQQEVHNAGQQREAVEQREILAAVNAKVIDYQNDACARYHLTAEAQDQVGRQLADLQEFVRAQEAQTGEEHRQLEAQQTRLAELHDTVLSLRSAVSSDQEIVLIRERVNALRGSFAILRAHLVEGNSSLPSSEVATSLIADLERHETDAFYLAFENRFRGRREEIKERLRFYLPIIADIGLEKAASKALDLGCGRGEWLELLLEREYDGAGVDLNICMVEECISRGLKAECLDAIAYLKSVPSGSFSVVTGFHIVEHLSFAVLFDLFQETFRVLRPRGRAIFETPNPECARVSLYSFFLDPTHRNPVPQELLCFLGAQAGFSETRVERLQPYVEDGVFKGYLDYSGIFTK